MSDLAENAKKSNNSIMPNKAQIIFINYQEPVINFDMNRVLRKPVFGVSDQVRHKAVVT